MDLGQVQPSNEHAVKFHLDPDFRSQIPRNADGTFADICAKCQKRVNAKTARKAWVNWETHMVSLGREEIAGDHVPDVIGEEFIGPDCWKAIGLPKQTNKTAPK